MSRLGSESWHSSGAPPLRRLPDRALEEVADLVLQHPIGRWPDRITHPFGFEELVDLRVGEGRIAAEIAPLHSATVAGDYRLQYFSPAGGAVHVARAQGRTARDRQAG